VQRLCLTILCLAFLATPSLAEYESLIRSGGQPTGIRLAGTEDPAGESRVYIVQLATPAAAEAVASAVYGVIGKPTAGTGRGLPRFDKNSVFVQNHVERLNNEQAAVIAKIGDSIEPLYSYRYSLNGFAARMSPAQANKLEHMDDVLNVWEDEVRPLATRDSARFLGLFDADSGLRGGLDGDGIIIGVIDSGIAPGHPALRDTREADRPRLCRSTWAETSLLGLWLCRRFDKMEDVTLFDPPKDWNGTCETGDRFTEQNCNNKMVGARFFPEGAQATGPIDRGEIFSPRDVDGHGTHIATTAAGNQVKASIFGTFLGNVEGMAPRARIAAYKACWLRPGATRAACNTSDLARAIDMAVADGVDIINYSIGSSLYTITAPDDLALLAAAKAGVLAVVAAGNEGPNYQTITSPAGNPAVITTAASSREGSHALEALQVNSPPGVAGKYAVQEAAFTPALADRDPLQASLVLVDDGSESLADGSQGTLIDGCQALVNDSEISGNIAFIQRGGCDFDVKVSNADDAGAIAAVIFNLSGPPIVMTGVPGLSDIPALMIGAADGNLLLDELNAEQVIDVVLDKSLFLTVEDTGNILGSFSSRGPGTVADIIKPDVTAPGINILAGHTPDAIATAPGEYFSFLTGTSMAAPHVSGVAALIKQAHPDWSPAAIKSALMTTARQDVRMPDEADPIPYDFGSGHIVPNDANDPGLVYDITADEYDAFSCGVDSTDVSEARCAELEAAGMSFEAFDLNQPNIAVSRLTAAQTITRRVTSVSEDSETYSLELEMPAGVNVQVTPSSLTLGPGQSAEFDVTMNFVDGPQDLYRFGSLSWVSDDHRVRSVLAVRPLSVDAPREIISFGGSGSVTFPVEFGYSGAYVPGVHGLRLPFVANGFVDDDPDKAFTFRTNNGVTAHTIAIGPDELFLRFAMFDELTDGDDDLDLYIYYCPDGVNCIKVGESGEETSREQVDIFLPGAGMYVAFVHGFATDNVAGGPGANYSLLAWSVGRVDNPGNMSASGPAFVTAGSTEDVTVTWTGLAPDNRYLGGISHNTPNGLASFTVVNIGN
jgi:subtilisin family serine protease